MQCNIDARGKAVRLRFGIAMTVIGCAIVALRIVGILRWDWAMWLGIGFVLVGGFGIFQARAGWCAVRAMGFKTRVCSSWPQPATNGRGFTARG